MSAAVVDKEERVMSEGLMTRHDKIILGAEGVLSIHDPMIAQYLSESFTRLPDFFLPSEKSIQKELAAPRCIFPAEELILAIGMLVSSIVQDVFN